MLYKRSLNICLSFFLLIVHLSASGSIIVTVFKEAARSPLGLYKLEPKHLGTYSHCKNGGDTYLVSEAGGDLTLLIKEAALLSGLKHQLDKPEITHKDSAMMSVKGEKEDDDDDSILMNEPGEQRFQFDLNAHSLNDEFRFYSVNNYFELMQAENSFKSIQLILPKGRYFLSEGIALKSLNLSLCSEFIPEIATDTSEHGRALAAHENQPVIDLDDNVTTKHTAFEVHEGSHLNIYGVYFNARKWSASFPVIMGLSNTSISIKDSTFVREAFTPITNVYQSAQRTIILLFGWYAKKRSKLSIARSAFYNGMRRGTSVHSVAMEKERLMADVSIKDTLIVSAQGSSGIVASNYSKHRHNPLYRPSMQLVNNTFQGCFSPMSSDGDKDNEVSLPVNAEMFCHSLKGEMFRFNQAYLGINNNLNFQGNTISGEWVLDWDRYSTSTMPQYGAEEHRSYTILRSRWDTRFSDGMKNSGNTAYISELDMLWEEIDSDTQSKYGVIEINGKHYPPGAGKVYRDSFINISDRTTNGGINKEPSIVLALLAMVYLKALN
ncbi:hypothetical protein ACH42_02950 [Endozoicomonas sp. (ex Bugula neritina AB1)]|nr:hypothetical protein ACH42_02950 [Endozoicomonas sp. (ex Bugula neritina AB1)]